MDPELERYIKRLQLFLGPDCWQEHIPTSPEPVPEQPTVVDTSDSEDIESGVNLPDTPAPKISMAMPVSWPETGLAKGERSKPYDVFVPWKLVKSYPHQYIGKANAERARPFFNNSTIHSFHPWDFYYIHDTNDLKDSSILFVPTYQFEQLLFVINDKLDTMLTIPGHKNEVKFNVTFGIGSTPVPRFLGRSGSFVEFEALKKSIPPHNPEDDISGLSTMAQQDYLQHLKTIRLNSKGAGSKTKKSEKKRTQRIQDHRSWGKSLKRVQRYLGIRKPACKENPQDIPAFKKLSIADDIASDASAVSVPVVAPPERSVIFVAIDIEAFEFSPDLITEIGVAVYDTVASTFKSPGDRGNGWFDFIQGYHFRIRENAWAKNKVHVEGNADKFDFGTTEFVSENRIRKTIANIIANPLSLQPGYDKTKTSDRPVVLVFHDTEADAKFLQSLNYDVKKAKNVLEIVDTRDMYQHAVQANNPASLERILADLEIQCRYLHNAGNDAVYTLQAMIGLAFKQRQKSLERARDKAKEEWSGTKRKDEEGWLTGGEESDGGRPGEKGKPVGWTGNSFLQGAAFQPGADEPRRAPSPPASRPNVFSWSDAEDEW